MCKISQHFGTFLLTGGHTQIYYVKSINNYKIIGKQLMIIYSAINSAGVAKLLIIEYPHTATYRKIIFKKDYLQYIFT